MNQPRFSILEQENFWGYRKRLRFILNSIVRHFPGRAASSVRILDVGCGNGSMLALPLAQQNYRVTGIDLDWASIARARDLGGDLPATFVCGDLRALSPALHYEVVICSEVLEHQDEPAQLLAECVQRLQGSGLLLLTVPNGYGPFEIESRVYRKLHLERVFQPARRWLRKRRGLGTLPSTENVECRHKHFFAQRRLRKLFEACGLRVQARSSGSLFCGPFSEAALRWFPWLFGLNAKVSDYLPALVQSSWYFALVRRMEDFR